MKGFFSALAPPSIAGEPERSVEGAVSNPVRLNVFWQPVRTVSGTFAYELTLQVQEGEGVLSEETLPRPEPFSYRAADLKGTLYPASADPRDSFALLQNLDRAFLTLSLPAADLYLGRQPIAFGSARVVNPTDVIAPFTYEALDKEEVSGVDAFRVRLPVGMMGELDVGAVFGDRFSLRSGAVFLRGKLYLLETDFALMGMLFRKHLLLGVDLARSVGNAGTWLEAAWTVEEAVGASRSNGSYARISGGFDTHFSNGVYGFVEYHFNGAGGAQARQYFDLLGEVAFTEGGVYLMGRHYVAPGLTYQVTPLLTVSAQALVNLKDGSVFVAPRVEYSLAEDAVLEAGAFYSSGRRMQATSGPSGRTKGEPQSEFGLYPAVYTTSLRVYF